MRGFPRTEPDRPLRVLFVLYHDFSANSAAHVHALANELTELGQSCAVAVPFQKDTIRLFGRTLFEPLLFEELERNSFRFPDGRGPDIVHAWTPREIVRKFCERLAMKWRFRQFVHMEDNEWHILAQNTGLPWEEIISLDGPALDNLVPNGLSHPINGMEFMRSASGLTVIVDRLTEISPPGVPNLVLWPSASRDFFFPRPLPKTSGRALGVPEGDTVLVYVGNVHAANAREVRSLYLAVAMLNREGLPTTLIRAGRDFFDFLGPDPSWGRAHSIELGSLPRREIASLLTLADIFVQPGRADAFNDFRFPSKVPEFLSVGRPVILPASNIGLEMTHGKHAYVIENADATAIADAIRNIMGDSDLYRTLAEGSIEFFNQRLDWTRSAGGLLAFYREGKTQNTLCQEY